METITTKTITSTFIDKKSNHSIVKTELTNEILIKTIQEFIITQYELIFYMIPHPKNLKLLVDGFILFNLCKNKDMLSSKNKLIEYINNPSISFEEKLYFIDIVLYIQKPNFLTIDEIRRIKAYGIQ